MLEEAFPNCSFNNRKSLIRQRCDDAYKKITQGQGKSAIADLEKLRIKARKNKDFKTEVSYLASIGNFLVEMGQLEEATEIWKKAVKTAEENHCNFQLPEAYNGYLACSRDLYENTPARAKELKGIVEKYVVALDKYQPDEIRRGNSLKVLGKRLMDTRHLDLAKAVYEKSIAEQKGIHFTTMRFVFDPEIKDEQADPAIWQKHDQISLAATQVELGMVLGWQRKIKEARALLQQGIATLEQKTPESKQILWMAYGMAARFERQICKDYERALRYIEQAESVLSNDHLSVPPEISNEKSAILRAMNK
jgi:tetratricopeptide (TPR) repeat protein